MARTFAIAPALTIPLRTDWEETWLVKQADATTPVNLTGYKARMQLRDRVTGALMLDLSSDIGNLVITPLTGQIALHVTSDVVKGVSPTNVQRNALWDVEVYIPGTPEYVVPLFTGKAKFAKRVTTTP